MHIEPEAKAAADTVIHALAQTKPDVGVVACVDVAIRILVMTGLEKEKAIETLLTLLEKFAEVEESGG